MQQRDYFLHGEEKSSKGQGHKLPQVRDPMMCRVFNLKVLLDSLPTDPTTPLLCTTGGTTLTQSMIQRRLTSILTLMQVPLAWVGFHNFRRSAATITFDA